MGQGETDGGGERGREEEGLEAVRSIECKQAADERR